MSLNEDLPRVSKRMAAASPWVPASLHDKAMALPLRDAPVARRVGPGPTHPDQAVCAVRLPALKGHSVRRGRKPGGLKAGRGTAATRTGIARSVRARRADIGQTGVLRVAWTLADLAGRTVPGADEVAEALGMRLQRAA